MVIGNPILASLPHDVTHEETTFQLEGINAHAKVESSHNITSDQFCLNYYHANNIGHVCSKIERIKYYHIIRDKTAMYSIILNDETQNYHLIFYNLLCNTDQQKIYSDNGFMKKIASYTQYAIRLLLNE